ncbi:carboxypeptidase S [Panus rudis PR-1116 ss-1]|nr:carboxypeptidase S [Panus rudis PR-1116 ss-1]
MQADHKIPLDLPTYVSPIGGARRKHSTTFKVILVAVVCGFIALRFSGIWERRTYTALSHTSKKESCPQTPPITPVKHADLYRKLEEVYATKSFQEDAFASLGGAIRIPTEMYDDLLSPGHDPRWEVFGDFHEYLTTRFPNVHQTLERTTVNTYALVYKWRGTDEALKPILLTAHQDVVPVDPSTVGNWVYPPFSGHYDGEWIWGRGSCDDKVDLISQLTAIETLIDHGYRPERTVVLAYGIDEERGGAEGASAIRDYLLQTYGRNAFAILIDEGGSMEAREDLMFAAPAVAEKGYFDLRIEVSSPGGHSSVPPAHTSIGILASVIVQLEANPHEPGIRREDTYFQTLQCQAAYDPEMDDDLRGLIKHSRYDDSALKDLEKTLFQSRQAKALGGTTQATDLIGGGVKTNALPENAWAIVNHRIASHSSISSVKAHIMDTTLPIVKKHGLSLNAFGRNVSHGDVALANGLLTLSEAREKGLDPAPVTPTTDNPAFTFLSGTIVSVGKTSVRWDHPENMTIVVGPGIMTGNTGMSESYYTSYSGIHDVYFLLDTRYYWDLTPNIFRYRHVSQFDKYNGAHTVNEALFADAMIDLIRFFTTIILNADETGLLA